MGILYNIIYPLVNVYITNWKITMPFMGKSTISTGPFSIAMLVYQRVMISQILSIVTGCLRGDEDEHVFLL